MLKIIKLFFLIVGLKNVDLNNFYVSDVMKGVIKYVRKVVNEVKIVFNDVVNFVIMVWKFVKVIKDYFKMYRKVVKVSLVVKEIFVIS